MVSAFESGRRGRLPGTVSNRITSSIINTCKRICENNKCFIMNRIRFDCRIGTINMLLYYKFCRFENYENRRLTGDT
jgi:hypothetical protein